MTKIDDTKDYIKYANDIINKKILSGRYVYLACKRFIDWFSRDDMYFDYDIVDKKIRFINCMKHYQGSFAGKPFLLMGWESWVLANLWGWKWKHDDTNVINKALISMSRKNAKTAICAAIALCHVIFDEIGAEVDLLANSSQQASIAFDHTMHFAKSLDKKEKVFKRYRNSIKIPKTESIIQLHSADSGTKDGFNSSLFIMDEFGASKTWDLYNVFISSMGMRRNPLAIVISTAGFLLHSYPMFEYVKQCKDILDKLNEDDTQFAAIYMMDEDDDWKDENNWIKSNPSLGETVTYKYLRDQVKMAELQPSTETSTKTKNLNMFCSSKDVWIQDKYITDNLQKIDLKDYEGEQCYIGVDLATVSDMAAISVMIPPNPLRELNPYKFIFKIICYLPESALEEAFNAELYKQWKRTGFLTITSGNVIDYDYILNDILAISEILLIQEIEYDTYNATQWAINATDSGLNLEPYSQTLGNFNKPVKYFEILLKSGRILIDANPIFRWMMNNVELKYDHAENAKPFKAGNDVNKKIDGIIAMLEALGGFLANNNNYSFDAFSVDKLV